MKYKMMLMATLLCFGISSTIAKVKLPAILSDGMVLQRERPVKIWGKADVGEKILLTFNKKKYRTLADAEGRWQIVLPAMKAGGPYMMSVNDIQLKDVLVGDVWLCSGQSNMELQTYRVKDMFGKEIATDENTMIHYVKTPLNNDLHGAKDDFPSIKWQSLTKETAPSFSALAYFYAKQMYQLTKVPVGIINSSWGGSAVEAWISEEGLRNYPRLLNERDIYNSDEYRSLCSKLGSMMYGRWNTSLYKGDVGLQTSSPWYSINCDDSDWQSVDILSTGWAPKNDYPINGSHWFRQTVKLSTSQINQEVVLRVGTIVDADSVYVNGVLVGTTAYQYPPRIYRVPKSVLKEGDNQITVRLISYTGLPHFVKDKPYCLICGTDTVWLSRQWKYKLGCEMPARLDPISFQNIPTGMYNSMIAPLRQLSFKGVLWYQGETNTWRPNEYEALLSTMITDWRDKLSDEHLPFFVVQLANFMESHAESVESSWAALREAQRQVTLKVPQTDLAVAIDLGEWNDIHPQNKKELARRISLLVMNRLYGKTDVVAEGPVCTSMKVEGQRVVLSFKKGTDDLLPVPSLKGFSIAGDDGHFYWAKATIVNGNEVAVWNDEVKNPVKVRYAWDDNPKDVNLKNKSELPASPFQITKKY